MREFLRFVGMETSEKARGVLLWALPYLGVFAVLLVGLSYIVQRYVVALGLWMHAVAILCALVVFFLFVAWGRRLAGEAMEGGADPHP